MRTIIIITGNGILITRSITIVEKLKRPLQRLLVFRTMMPWYR